MARWIATWWAFALLTSGCTKDLNRGYMTDAMMDRGLVVILPGIQGVDSHYTSIRHGLQEAGVDCAIKIDPWGSHIPGLDLAINETDTRDDRGWGRKIAGDISAYLGQYPGRPVFIIGHSGGAGVGVFAAENLATGGDPSRELSGLLLLDASLSASYDLSTALQACRLGIANFYNPGDVGLLGAGTALFGNVDGGHGDSAGRTGFHTPYPRLFPVDVAAETKNADILPHFADTTAAFARRYLAPWVLQSPWPPKPGP